MTREIYLTATPYLRGVIPYSKAKHATAPIVAQCTSFIMEYLQASRSSPRGGTGSVDDARVDGRLYDWTSSLHPEKPFPQSA